MGAVRCQPGRRRQKIVAEIELHKVAEAAKGILRHLHNTTTRQIDALQVHQMSLLELSSRKRLQNVSSQIEHLSVSRNVIGNGAREAAALGGSFSTAPLTAAGRRTDGWTRCGVHCADHYEHHGTKNHSQREGTQRRTHCVGAPLTELAPSSHSCDA